MRTLEGIEQRGGGTPGVSRCGAPRTRLAAKALRRNLDVHPQRIAMNFDLARTTELLRRTPAALRALLEGLDDQWLRATEGPDTFSPFDVLGHLIDGEETDWIPRARIILAGGPSPRFEPYDRFRHYARNAGRSLTSLLDEFARLRAANLELLRSEERRVGKEWRCGEWA